MARGRAMEHPHVALAEAYAADVRSGRRPACQWERLAVDRWVRDRDGESAGPYRFEPLTAERVCRFIERLPHTKGAWAARRETIRLEGWQCFVLVNAYGWLRKSDSKRRFREVVTIVPRKNGKSILSAGVGLYMLCADGEHGAEIYSGAGTEKQAWEVFRPARQMAEGRPDLRQHFGIAVNSSNINIVGNGSRFEPMIGKPGDGAMPSCAIIDEYHEHDSADQYDTMLTGQGAREQPLMWVISTAGDNLAGPCFDKILTCRKILEGVIEDDEKFFIEYTVDTQPYSLTLHPEDALARLDHICDRGGCVTPTQISRLWGEVCADLAITAGGKRTRSKNASDIPTGVRLRADYAEPVTSKPYSTKIRSGRPAQSPSGSNGIEKIPTESELRGNGGEPNQKRDIGSSLTGGSSITEFQQRNIESGANNRMANAPSAVACQNLYASITATAQELFGDCSADNAIRQSAFSAILRKVYNAHSTTCAVRRCELLNDGSLRQLIPEDDWTAPEAIAKANPNLDVSVSAEFLLARQREAVRNTREQGRFKTKHLNLWVNARAAYFNMQSWAGCHAELRLEDFEGQRCKIALDLASKQDIAAMQILFDLGDGSFATFGRYYLPEDVVEEPGKDHYRGWALADPPKLILTQGNMIDFGRIEEDIDDIRRKYTVEEITFDPAQATMLMTRLMAKGANVSEFQQTAANFTEPMKQVAALIDAGRLKHNCDANDPMTWMMSNVTARLDGKDQVFPRKERPENKIDGPVALIMTMRLAMIEVPPVNIATLIA